MSLLKMLAAGGALAFAVSSAYAAPALVTFNNSSLGGSNNFTFDGFITTTVNESTIVLKDGGNGVLDLDSDGLLNGLVTTDTFTETGLIINTNFTKGGVLVGPGVSGINLSYEMFIVYMPPDGTLHGIAARDSANNAIAVFTEPTSAKIFYDTNVNGTFESGSSTEIGSLTLSSTALSNCVLPGLGSAQGTCVINALFDDSGTTGVWTMGGTDIASLGATMRLDFNVDQTTPAFSATFPPNGEQVVRITHDGSSEFAVAAVPEPASLALVGLGLFGLGALRRQARNN